MSIYWTIILGFVIGVHAELLLPERAPAQTAATALAGVAGALLAGLVATGIGWYGSPGDARGLIVSILGAIAAVIACSAATAERAVRR